MSNYRKQPRPMPNRASGLWSKCVFAHAAGWSKGFRSDGSLQDCSVEDQRRGVPTWTGSLDADNYVPGVSLPGIDIGRSFRGGGASIDQISYADTLDRYDLQGTNRLFTAAVLVRPVAVQTDDRILFSKKANINPGDAGWGWGTGFGGSNKYRFELSDGATEVFGDTIKAQNVNESVLLTATYNTTNLRLFVNGILENTIAGGGVLIGLNNEPVRFFGNSANGNYNAVVSMGAVWNRILADSEIAKLYTDPFFMWRTDLHKEFMFGNVGGGTRFQTFFLNFG